MASSVVRTIVFGFTGLCLATAVGQMKAYALGDGGSSCPAFFDPSAPKLPQLQLMELNLLDRKTEITRAFDAQLIGISGGTKVAIFPEIKKNENVKLVAIDPINGLPRGDGLRLPTENIANITQVQHQERTLLIVESADVTYVGDKEFKTIYVVDVVTNKLISTVATEKIPQNIFVTTIEGQPVIVTLTAGTIHSLNALTGASQKLAELPESTPRDRLIDVFQEEGKIKAVVAHKKQVIKINLNKGTQESLVKAERPLFGSEMMIVGKKRLAVAIQHDNSGFQSGRKISIIDLKKQKEVVAVMPKSSESSWVKLTTFVDNKSALVLATDVNGVISVIQSSTGKIINSIQLPKNHLKLTQIEIDGQKFFMASGRSGERNSEDVYFFHPLQTNALTHHRIEGGMIAEPTVFRAGEHTLMTFPRKDGYITMSLK